MKEMNEQQTDMLITQAMERRHIVEEINRAVMCDVRRIARRRKLQYWKRAVAFSFGLPLVLLVFGVLFGKYVVPAASGVYALPCVCFPVLTVLYAAFKSVGSFSAGQDVIKQDTAGLISEV